MAEASLTLADIERNLGPLSADDQDWLLGRLSVTAASEMAEALTALDKRRGQNVPVPQAGDQLVAEDGTRWGVVNLPDRDRRARMRLISHQAGASNRRPHRIHEVRAQHGELTLAHRPTAASATTAGILREAARVTRSQAPTVLGVAQTIRLAAGGDAAGRARAEAALLFVAHFVEPGLRVDGLERWRDRRTCLQVVEALELAAAAAEQGGAR